MALLTTFPKLGASPGLGLSGALPWGRAQSIADGSLRPIGAASGGLRSVQAGDPGAICQAAISAAGRALFWDRSHACPRARGDLSRASPMVARVFRQAANTVSGRGP